MQYTKVTEGCVIQTFVDGVCVSQVFEASGQVEYATEDGEPCAPPADEQYQPFDMVQPVSSNDYPIDVLTELAQAIFDAMDMDNLESDFLDKQIAHLRSCHPDVVREALEEYGV